MAKNTRFTLDQLKNLDFGRVEKAFQRELKHCVLDCKDRPALNKPREIALVFRVRPDNDTNSANDELDAVSVEVEISSKVPKRHSKVYSMLPQHDGNLLFNPDLPDDPDQETLYDEQETKEDQQ